jgi:hypothetical protein
MKRYVHKNENEHKKEKKYKNENEHGHGHKITSMNKDMDTKHGHRLRNLLSFCQANLILLPEPIFVMVSLFKGTVSRDFLIRFMTLKTKSVLFVQALIV